MNVNKHYAAFTTLKEDESPQEASSRISSRKIVKAKNSRKT